MEIGFELLTKGLYGVVLGIKKWSDELFDDYLV